MIAAALHKGPGEQAEAFARLRGRGHVTAAIAAKTGYSESTISAFPAQPAARRTPAARAQEMTERK